MCRCAVRRTGVDGMYCYVGHALRADGRATWLSVHGFHGHRQSVRSTGGVTVTPASTNGSDTFQATSGGSNVSSVTIPAGSTSVTFYLTPGGTAGNRSISITTSPALTYTGSPITYNGIGTNTAIGYTVTGPSGGHQNHAATWTVTLTPPGSTFFGTVTATPSGGQLLSPFTTTWATEPGPKTFTFTPVDADAITWTYTNSGGLTNPSPETYVSTAVYLQDTFQGTAGTQLQSHTSDTGSSWGTPTGGNIELDGNGKIYLESAGDSYSLSNATMPTALPFEVQYDFTRLSAVSGAIADVIFMSSTGNQIYLRYQEGGGFVLCQNETNLASEWDAGPAIGVTWRIKISVQPNSNPQYTDIHTYYSTDGGNTWSNIPPINPFVVLATSLPSSINVGPYFQGSPSTATTGIHLGNLVVQDIPDPTVQIPNGCVFTSGKTVPIYFESFSERGLRITMG